MAIKGKNIKIRASGGGEFDCYLVNPEIIGKLPAVVLASAIHGVDADLRAIPWMSLRRAVSSLRRPTCSGVGARSAQRDDPRSPGRGQPRLDQGGESDGGHAGDAENAGQFQRRGQAMGFCYGGPYAILGPKRLGYAAGISCHGTQLGDFNGELDGVAQPASSGRSITARAAPRAGNVPQGAACGRARERRSAYFSRRRARLHDAGQPEGVQPGNAQVFDGARARDIGPAAGLVSGAQPRLLVVLRPAPFPTCVWRSQRPAIL